MEHSKESIVIDQILLNNDAKIWSNVGALTQKSNGLFIDISSSSSSLLDLFEPDPIPFGEFPDEKYYFNPFGPSWDIKHYQFKIEYGYPKIFIEPPYENRIVFHLWSQPLRSKPFIPSLLQSFHFETNSSYIDTVYSELQPIHTIDLHLKGETNTCLEVKNVRIGKVTPTI